MVKVMTVPNLTVHLILVVAEMWIVRLHFLHRTFLVLVYLFGLVVHS